MSSSSSSQNSMSIRGIAVRGRGRGGRGGWVPKGSIMKKMEEPKDDVQLLTPKDIIKKELDIFHIAPPTQEDLENFAKIKNFGGSDIVNSDDDSDEDVLKCDLCGKKDHRTRHCNVFKPKPAESNMGACYYCKKPGHFKADCPKKLQQQKNNGGKKNDFGSSRTSSFANRSQNRNYSENSAGVSNAGNSSQTGYGAPWSVVTKNPSRADRVPLPRVPLPIAATSKASVQLRPEYGSQFNTTAEISGGTASSKMPSQPPKSKIEYCRSESEEYESEEHTEKKDDTSEKDDAQEETSDSKEIPSNAVNIEVVAGEVNVAQNEEKESNDEVEDAKDEDKDRNGESKNVLDESEDRCIKEAVEDEVKEVLEDEVKEVLEDESKDVEALSDKKNEVISLEQKISNDGSANVRCVEFDSDSSPEEFGDPEDEDVYGQYGALVELSSEEEQENGKDNDENDEVNNEIGDENS